MSEQFLSDPDNLIFVRGVTMQPPTGLLQPMEFFEEFGGLAYFDSAAIASVLEDRYRAGLHQFTFNSAIVGEEVYNLTVPNASILPPSQILNFTAAQAIDETQPFTLIWDPPSPDPGGFRVEIYELGTGAQVYMILGR